jgi:Cu(I)/Ag(I) efflux system membrane fusion protein
MDPNFKRDKPGKSPMGMDLVPVFANDVSSDSPGTVKIDPVTINNLGVKTTRVGMVTPNLTISALGRVAFAEDAIVHIHPRVEGWIESLAVRSKGEYVEQGEALYSLYSPDLVNAQEELLIALAQGNRGLIEGAKSRLMALNAPASLIKRIEDNRKIERTITFTAPKSGYVNELNIQSGFYVKPSTTMMSIANMDKVWVLGDIFASDISKIALGQAAIVKSDYFPTKELAAEISYIYPTLNPRTRTAIVRLVLDNPDSMLKPDMFTSVTINAFQADSEISNKVLAIPEQAVIRSGDSDRVVLVLGEGKFKSINVTLGRVFDDVIEVVSGLEEGDLIVSSAQFLLDSESSISSDFMRMEAPETVMTNAEEMDMEVSAWTSASVNEVMLDERKVNITHGPLDAFNMMGMSMNFMVADDIDISQFEEGMEVHVEVVKTPSGMYMIKTAHFKDMDMNMNDEANDHQNHGGHAQ